MINKCINRIFFLLFLFIIYTVALGGCKGKGEAVNNQGNSSSVIEDLNESQESSILNKGVIDSNNIGDDINEEPVDDNICVRLDDTINGNTNGTINGDINDDSDYENDKQLTVPSGSQFEVHFIDVGQGDSSLIICQNEAMLIDAGDNSKGTRVQKYLKDHGITELKYVIGTHPDADHIGGLDVIIYKFACDNILMPDATSDTKSFKEVLSAIDSKGYSITTVGEGDTFTLGDASFEILSPVKGYPYADNNNNSIVLRLDYYNNSFLFMADVKYQPQQVIYYDDELNAKADVVKVSHHGANSGYMKAFYDEVSPEYAIISVGKGNDYGHPHEDVLNDFKSRGVKVFRTDEQGSIVAISDGNKITFNVEPSITWAVGEIEEQKSETSQSAISPIGENNETVETSPDAGITYVLNTNSMKFHYPTCNSVQDMKEKNRLDVTWSREKLLENYPDAVPCKRCKP